MYFLSLTADIFHNQVAKYTAGVSQLEWRETGQLPGTRARLRAAMVDNVLYVTGGGDGYHRLPILSWDPTNESWQPAGSLAFARSYHAAVAVHGSPVWCPSFVSSSMIESGWSPTLNAATTIEPGTTTQP